MDEIMDSSDEEHNTYHRPYQHPLFLLPVLLEVLPAVRACHLRHRVVHSRIRIIESDWLKVKILQQQFVN